MKTLALVLTAVTSSLFQVKGDDDAHGVRPVTQFYINGNKCLLTGWRG